MNIHHVVHRVASEFCCKRSDIFGPSLLKRQTIARQVICYVAATLLQMSHEDIAKTMFRERSTVTHACKKVEERMKVDKYFEARVLSLLRPSRYKPRWKDPSDALEKVG